MFLNTPTHIICHFSDFISLSEMKLYYKNLKYPIIDNSKSNKYNHNFENFTNIPFHYFITPDSNIISITPDNMALNQKFSNNAVHICVSSKNNFATPTNEILTTLYFKIFEIQNTYQIPFSNIISSFESKLKLGEISYQEWKLEEVYYRNNIIYATDGVFYNIIDNSFNTGVTENQFKENYFNTYATSISTVNGKITLNGVVTSGKSSLSNNTSIFIYDFPTTNKTLYDEMNNKIFQIYSVSGNIVTLNKNLIITTLSENIKFYMKIKPISDFNVRKVFNNEYFPKRLVK